MRKLWNIFRKTPMERGLDREFRYHVDRRVEELCNSGLGGAEARRQALIEFGGVAQVEEEARDVWFWRWLYDFARDARYAARGPASRPGFAATAILSLALGIGANTAIFSILHALVLRSLPVSDPHRLFVVTRNETASSPYPLFVELRDHSQILEGVLAFRTNPMRVNKDGQTERVTGALVCGAYFDVLGVRPHIGTAIEKQDDVKWGSGGWRGPVAVLSHGYWLRRFGGSADAVGARILVNDHPFTIAGVAAPGFTGTEVGEPADLFAPMTMQEVLLPRLLNTSVQPQSQWLRIFGRLKTGVQREQAEAELTTLLRRYNAEFYIGPATSSARRKALTEQRIVLLPGGAGLSQLRRRYSKPLWVLMSVVALVLLIACANVASLLLSRASARRREIAIRLSLGAARSRLVSQLFTESVVLAAAGAASGLVLARWLRDGLIRFLPEGRTLDAPIDPGMVLFTLAIAAGAALLFGLAPAFQSAKVDLAPAIKGEEIANRPSRLVLRKGLVVFQMSLSLLLVAGAVLFLRSLHNLLSVDPGFARENILIAPVESGPGLDARLLDEARRLPGVVSAALAGASPLGNHTGCNVYVPGYVPKPVEPRDSPWVGFISPGYFRTMGIPLLLGRDIDDRDFAGQRDVMVVNEAFARHFFEGQNPIGRRVGTRQGEFRWEIIGVVKDSKYTGLRDGSIRRIYVPARPGPWASHIVVHLRTRGDPLALAAALRQKVRGLDKTATIFDVHTVQDELDRSLLRERLLGTVTPLFGVLALVLAIVGLYGLTAFGVAWRTREFGIRIAIGARTGSIAGLVVREAMWLVAAGAVFGLGAAWALGRIVQTLLFAVESADPMNLALAAGALVAVTLLAAWIPARRASRVSPTQALRYE